MLYNIHTGDWDDELLQILKVPRPILPEVRASSEVYGETQTPAFSAPIPIAGAAGDQQAALFGQLCTRPGMVKNTYGTGCFMLMNTGTTPVASANNLLTTVAWKIGGRTDYALEGSVFIGGAVVQWLRDGLGIIDSSAAVEALALRVADTGGVYLVPAFAGLGAPQWDPYARGILVGITRGTTAAHIARAALESIAYQSADLLNCMLADSRIAIGELRVDGGATANDTLMQFQADILGLPVVLPPVRETTAQGAAYLAGLAVGVWKNAEEIGDRIPVERRFLPNMDRERSGTTYPGVETGAGAMPVLGRTLNPEGGVEAPDVAVTLHCRTCGYRWSWRILSKMRRRGDRTKKKASRCHFHGPGCLFPVFLFPWVYRGFTFSAAGPFGPCLTSKLTRWPSANVLKPTAWMAL